MTDKTTIMRAFNTHFFEFLDDIISILPENMDLQVAKTSFEGIKRANPTSIIKAWALYVYEPYKDIIDSGDIRFFFNKNYEEDLNTLANAKEIMKIIDTLREPVNSMSPTSQASSMEYIQNLSKLSTLYPK